MNQSKVRARSTRRKPTESDQAAEMAKLKADAAQAWTTLIAVIRSNPTFKAAWEAHCEAADAVWEAEAIARRAADGEAS